MAHTPHYRWAPRVSTTQPSAFVRIGASGWALIAILVVTQLAMGAEPLLGAACVLIIPVGLGLLWRKGEPPILFAIFFLQWMSVSTAVFQANVNGTSLDEMFDSSGIVTATWLSLAGLLVLAATMRLAMKGVKASSAEDLRREVAGYSLRRIAQAYLGSILILLAVESVMWRIPGLNQLLLGLTGFRWAFFFVLAVTVLVNRRGYVLLALAFGYELVVGFTSFFSDFKMVFFVLALALVTARGTISRFTVAKMALVAAVVVVFSAMWSLVKTEYRDFLNQGSGEQVVLVGPMERLEKIASLMSALTIESIPEGFQKLADRVQYTEYFGRVAEQIPRFHPHEGGLLWWAAVRHVLMPRLLFPDKPGLTADIENTDRYTAMEIISQTGPNTEITLGYMAESYIDFGYFGMFIPIALLGLLYGLECRYFVSQRRHVLFAHGSSIAALSIGMYYGMSAVKILGGSLTAFIAVYLAFRYLVPPVHRWLTATGGR